MEGRQAGGAGPAGECKVVPQTRKDIGTDKERYTALQQLKPSIELTNEVGPSVSRDTFNIETFKLSLEALDIPYNPASNRKGSRNTKDGKHRKGAKSGNDMESSSARASEAPKEELQGMPETWEDIKRVCTQTMQVSTMGNADDTRPEKLYNAEMTMSPLHQPRMRKLGDSSRAGSHGVDTVKTKQEEEDHEDQDFAQSLVAKNDSEGYRYLGKSCRYSLTDVVDSFTH